MTNTYYIVSADHVSPRYRFTDTLVQVGQCSDGFYASHAKLGCGKTYATAEDAISTLFHDHACYTIVSRSAVDQFNAAYVYRNGGVLVELLLKREG